MTVLYKSDPVRGAVWAELFASKAPDLPFRMWPDIGNSAEVRYLVTWQLPERLEQTFPNLEVVFTIGAGVDQIDFSEVPAHIPIVRMIDPAIIDGMVEYVTQAVISIQRDLPDYAMLQANRQWRPMPVKAAAETRVGVLGLGSLASAVLERLVLFKYSCMGWSRSQRNIPDVTCFSGMQGLTEMIRCTDTLVCLLPLTDDTRGILSRTLLETLPKGASLIQTGRGPHLDQAALLDLLASGQIRNAFLDVTDPEPLPPDHALWSHPRVRITPHIASATRPETAFEVVLNNIRRHQAGLGMTGLVDRDKGY